MNRLVWRATIYSCRLTINRHGVRQFSSGAKKILIDTNTDTGVCKMKLNNPHANSLDRDMLDAAVKAIRDAESSPQIRGIILSSNSDTVFSEGLEGMEMYRRPREHLIDYWTRVQDLYLSWYGCSKPTVAVINGYTAGAGCAWSLMCDYRIMRTGATAAIGLTEAKLTPPASHFFINLMRPAINNKASELAQLQETMFDSSEALKIGLVDELDSPENLMNKAETRLKSLMGVPAQDYRKTKLLTRQPHLNKLSGMRIQDTEAFVSAVTNRKTEIGLGIYVNACAEIERIYLDSASSCA